ncbi:21332_t:CDS:2, partial [Dentiscutata erythropus]
MIITKKKNKLDKVDYSNSYCLEDGSRKISSEVASKSNNLKKQLVEGVNLKYEITSQHEKKKDTENKGRGAWPQLNRKRKLKEPVFLENPQNMEHKKNKMTIPSAQENKENKEKQTREQENKTAEPPLRWDKQVNKEITTLSDITNTTNIEQSEHIESNPEAKNTQVIDAKCSNSTNEIKVDNILDSEDFIEDLDFMEGYVTAASSKYKNVEKDTTKRKRTYSGRLQAGKRTWSSLFPKLTRGKTTFSSFSPRNTLKTKNDNTLIIATSSLQCSFNEIMEDLFKTAGYDINAAKQYFNRGKRSHIEIIFKDKATLQKYAAKGLMIKGRTYLGYIPTDARKS